MSEDMEKIKQELEEARKALESAKEDKERREWLEKENKQLIDARDKAKQKARDEEEERLKANQEFKELYTRAESEKEAISKQLEDLSGTLNTYRQREEEEFKGILEEIPEEMRADISDDAIPLHTRLSLARKIVGSKGKPAGFRGAGEGGHEVKTKADLKTTADQAAFINKYGREKYLALPKE